MNDIIANQEIISKIIDRIKRKVNSNTNIKYINVKEYCYDKTYTNYNDKFKNIKEFLKVYDILRDKDYYDYIKIKNDIITEEFEKNEQKLLDLGISKLCIWADTSKTLEYQKNFIFMKKTPSVVNKLKMENIIPINNVIQSDIFISYKKEKKIFNFSIPFSLNKKYILNINKISDFFEDYISHTFYEIRDLLDKMMCSSEAKQDILNFFGSVISEELQNIYTEHKITAPGEYTNDSKFSIHINDIKKYYFIEAQIISPRKRDISLNVHTQSEIDYELEHIENKLLYNLKSLSKIYNLIHKNKDFLKCKMEEHFKLKNELFQIQNNVVPPIPEYFEKITGFFNMLNYESISTPEKLYYF